MKICTTCKDKKGIEDFHKKSSNFDGLDYDCKLCANKKVRDRRVKNNNTPTKVYERTLKGKVMRTYRNMTSRVKGILKTKAHLYEGLSILTKEEFYEWSLNDEDYIRIFNLWVESGYEFKLSPSIDRKEPSLGYILSNMRWLTHSENSSLSDHSR